MLELGELPLSRVSSKRSFSEAGLHPRTAGFAGCDLCLDGVCHLMDAHDSRDTFIAGFFPFVSPLPLNQLCSSCILSLAQS